MTSSTRSSPSAGLAARGAGHAGRRRPVVSERGGEGALRRRPAARHCEAASKRTEWIRQLDARVLLAHALRLDHAGLVRESGRILAAAEITCGRDPGGTADRPRACRAHHRRAGILGHAARALRGDAGAAAGNGNRGRGGACRGRQVARARNADRRSRHRLGGHHAGAACRAARSDGNRDRSRSRRHCRCAPKCRAALACLACHVRGVRFRRGARGRVRPCGRESALCA